MPIDCPMCSGEYCTIHILEPCDCDTADRHGDKECGYATVKRSHVHLWVPTYYGHRCSSCGEFVVDGCEPWAPLPDNESEENDDCEQ